MVISSLVITAAGDNLERISAAASLLPGVEVYARIPENSKLVLVLESDTIESGHRMASEEIQSIPGVLAVQLAYCYYEEWVPEGIRV